MKQEFHLASSFFRQWQGLSKRFSKESSDRRKPPLSLSANSCFERSNSLRGTMFKKFIGLAMATLLLTFGLVVGSATAVELSEAVRTVPLNDKGETTVLSLKQVQQGKRLFNYACAQCHVGGITKTNQNIGLDPEALANATPSRNNLEGLVDYMKNPTTYDGEEEIAETHPSTKSADIYAAMRNLTDDDLAAIAGHILVQPKIVGEKWGGGKVYF
jgi:photosystem II cytochrome c550